MTLIRCLLDAFRAALVRAAERPTLPMPPGCTWLGRIPGIDSLEPGPLADLCRDGIATCEPRWTLGELALLLANSGQFMSRPDPMGLAELPWLSDYPEAARVAVAGLLAPGNTPPRLLAEQKARRSALLEQAAILWGTGQTIDGPALAVASAFCPGQMDRAGGANFLPADKPLALAGFARGAPYVPMSGIELDGGDESQGLPWHRARVRALVLHTLRKLSAVIPPDWIAEPWRNAAALLPEPRP